MAQKRTSIYKGASGASLSSLLRITSEAFMSADVNGDKVLSFEEFVEIVPDEMRAGAHGATDATLRELFDAADTNGNGEISKDEYLFWVLRWAAFDSGSSTNFKDQFKRFDSGGDGEVNLAEFSKAVDGYGFGEVAHHIFNEIDVDGSGTIRFEELLATLKAGHVKDMSDDAKRLLVQMSFAETLGKPGDDADATPQKLLERLDRASWKAADPEEVRLTISSRMQDAMLKPIELWRALVHAGGAKAGAMKLSKGAFFKALRKGIGLDGKDPLLEQVFRQIDDDNEGSAALDEFQNWINGRTGRRSLSRQLTLSSDRPEDDPLFPPLTEVEWNVKALQREINGMLGRSGISSYDLLMAYDSSDDSSLERKEFIVMMKKVVGNEDVWPDAKEVVKAVFDKVAGKDGSIDVEEFERFLSKDPDRDSYMQKSKLLRSPTNSLSQRQADFERIRRDYPLLVTTLNTAFNEADVDGDENLSFNEFYEVLPPDVREHTPAEVLRDVFELADVDKDGAITQDEFFFWSLGMARDTSGRSGSAWEKIQLAFEKVDTSGDGLIDVNEFLQAVAPYGFDEQLATKVFAELDSDGSDTLAYREIQRRIEAHCKGLSGPRLSPNSRMVLTAMALGKIIKPSSRRASREEAYDATASSAHPSDLSSTGEQAQPPTKASVPQVDAFGLPSAVAISSLTADAEPRAATVKAPSRPSIASQTREIRERRAEARTRALNAQADMDKANARAASAERDRLLAIDAERMRTQRLRRQIMEMRERREERREREPPSFGHGAIPMRRAAARIPMAASLRSKRRPVSAGGLLMPPGLAQQKVASGSGLSGSSSVPAASQAHYPPSWMPSRLREPIDPASLPDLALPLKPRLQNASPEEVAEAEKSARILKAMRAARKTPREDDDRPPRLYSEAFWEKPLPMNYLKGFDAPTYCQQVFTGCDRRAVPFW